jgi:hypothetical protein
VVLATVLLAASAVHLARFLRLATSRSLWNDEIFSIVVSSNKGPWEVVTRYQSNNHIFFNLINSLTPGAGSMDPARARMWSMVAAVAMLAVALAEFWRRGWFLAGAVFVALFAANPDWLDLTLQARGYAVTGLMATLCCMAVWRHLERPETGSSVVLGVASFIGTWTLPSFVMFAAPVWLALLAATRTRRVVMAGAATAVAIAVVYAPVAGQLWKETTTYGDIYGRSYTSIDSVGDTIRTYLLGSRVLDLADLSTVTILLVVVLLSVPLVALAPISSSSRRFALVCIASAGVFFGVNVALGTAALRTTSFAVVPLALAVLVPGSELVDWVRPKLGAGVRVSALVALSVAVMVVSSRAVAAPHGRYYLPIEDWAAASEHVQRTFPEGTGLAATGDWLGVLRGSHLDQGYPDDGDQSSATGLVSGRSLLFDSSPREVPAFDFSKISPVWSEARFYQRRGEYLRVLSAPPEQSRVSQVEAGQDRLDLSRLTDRRDTGVVFDSGEAVRVAVSGSRSRSLTLVAATSLPRPDRITVHSATGVETLAAGDLHRWGGSVTVYLGDQAVESVEITFPSGHDEIELLEVWSHPPRL